MKAKALTPAASWRFYVVLVLLAIAVAALVIRVVLLQVLNLENRGQNFLEKQGDIRTIRSEIIPAHRGMIVDRNGEPLAVSTPVASIWVNPKEFLKHEFSQDKVAIVANQLGLTPREFLTRINKHQRKSFIWLKRQLSPFDAEKVLAEGLAGVYARSEYQRFYPEGEVTAHVLGFTNIDDQGQEGLELTYDEWLAGSYGEKKVIKNLRGQTIKNLREVKPAKAGNNLQLSIDVRLQYLAYRELKAKMQQVDAKSGSVVMLDSHTGEVLAMVNQPSFNPNNRNGAQASQRRNRAVTDLFEPGSTVKPMTVVAALDSGKYTPQTKINTSPGHIRVGRKTLLDPVNYGEIDLTKIITKSSQVGITKVALTLDEDLLAQTFQRFGLGRSTGIEFPGERSGYLPVADGWSPIEHATFAFGYGVSVTPIQLAQAYAIFANQGRKVPVTLLKQDKESLQQAEQVITPHRAEQMVNILKTVTEPGGTATRAATSAWTAAGKTGTAHKVGKGGYEDNRYVAIFAGFAPVENPRIVTVIVVHEPQGNRYYGGLVAAPVFSKVMESALRILNVAPDKPDNLKIAGMEPTEGGAG